jgi:hemerythrin-like domain-containing protein
MATKPDAISILKEDHKKVKAMLTELEESSEKATKKRTTLLAKIDQEVSIHAQVEEEIFYPAYRDAAEKKEERQLFFEATEEHHVVKMVLPELRETDPSTEVFTAKAKVLKELIEHHAKEEEREMFPAAKRVLDKDELVALGEQIEARKAQLKKQKSAR